MKKIKLLQDVPFSPNGLAVETWEKDSVKEVDENLFKSFIDEGLAVAFEPEVVAKTAKPAKEPEDKPKRGPGRPPTKNMKESPKNKMYGFSPKDK